VTSPERSPQRLSTGTSGLGVSQTRRGLLTAAGGAAVALGAGGVAVDEGWLPGRGWSVIYRGPHREPLPVMIALHGLGGSHRSFVDELGIDRFLAAAVGSGVAPFAIAAVDGGTKY
jgi:hypothetical protein